MPLTDQHSSPMPPGEPATLIVTARPAPGEETAWEQALGDLIRTSLTFPGHLGSIVLKPRTIAEQHYRVITKFDSLENLQRWQRSCERQEKVTCVRALESEAPVIQHFTGLETWFELPQFDSLTAPNPPKYKMAVIIWIAVYLAVLPLISVLKPMTVNLPTPLGSAILAFLSVALMTWIVMPMLTWLFRGWLFRSPSDSPRP